VDGSQKSELWRRPTLQLQSRSKVEVKTGTAGTARCRVHKQEHYASAACPLKHSANPIPMGLIQGC
jgi:hypothetical protein